MELLESILLKKYSANYRKNTIFFNDIFDYYKSIGKMFDFILLQNEVKKQNEISKQRINNRKIDKNKMKIVNHNRFEILDFIMKKWPYKIGFSKWAGGDNDFELEIIKNIENVSIKTTKYREWSKNGKWSGNSYLFHIKIPQFYNLSIINSEFVITKQTPIENIPQACIYFTQSKGMNISINKGILLNNKIINTKNIEKKLKIMTSNLNIKIHLKNH